MKCVYCRGYIGTIMCKHCNGAGEEPESMNSHETYVEHSRYCEQCMLTDSSVAGASRCPIGIELIKAMWETQRKESEQARRVRSQRRKQQRAEPVTPARIKLDNKFLNDCGIEAVLFDSLGRVIDV